MIGCGKASGLSKGASRLLVLMVRHFVWLAKLEWNASSASSCCFLPLLGETPSDFYSCFSCPLWLSVRNQRPVNRQGW